MYKAGVLTTSDKCSIGKREDKSGKIIIDILKSKGYEVAAYDLIPDEPRLIKEKLINYCDNLKLDLVCTTGGTGLGPRDNTPQATLSLIERQVPGIPEAMRTLCLGITKRAMLSQAVAGLRKKTLIINFPGSSRGAKQSLEAIVDELGHGLDMILGKEH
jgi:molybdenum cofactor synthesis domain-containing protein